VPRVTAEGGNTMETQPGADCVLDVASTWLLHGGWFDQLVLPSLQASPAGPSLTAATLSDEMDLRTAGLVDSLGFVRLLAYLEQHLGVSIDLSELDPVQLTKVGALSRHIATTCSAIG